MAISTQNVSISAINKDTGNEVISCNFTRESLALLGSIPHLDSLAFKLVSGYQSIIFDNSDLDILDMVLDMDTDISLSDLIAYTGARSIDSLVELSELYNGVYGMDEDDVTDYIIESLNVPSEFIPYINVKAYIHDQILGGELFEHKGLYYHSYGL